MAKYIVQSPLKFQGRRVAVGKTVELDDATAAPLLECGAIEAPQKKPDTVKDGK